MNASRTATLPLTWPSRLASFRIEAVAAIPIAILSLVLILIL